jgi:hypothetical protein
VLEETTGLDLFHKAWPIYALAQQYLKNSSEKARISSKRQQARAQAMLPSPSSSIQAVQAQIPAAAKKTSIPAAAKRTSVPAAAKKTPVPAAAKKMPIPPAAKKVPVSAPTKQKMTTPGQSVAVLTQATVQKGKGTESTPTVPVSFFNTSPYICSHLILYRT